MALYKVWDATNETEEDALEVEGDDAAEAAVAYCEKRLETGDNETAENLDKVFVRTLTGELTSCSISVDYNPCFYASVDS